MDDRLQEAKTLFEQQSYNEAFGIFQELANNGNSEAAFYVAKMFRDGVGTSIDMARHAFWLKKAADGGIVEAGYLYGLLKVSQAGQDAKIFNEGMRYIEKAANLGNQDAVSKYIEIAERGNVNKSHIKKAIKLCSQLENQQTDAFDKQIYIDKANNLKARIKGSKGGDSSNRITTIMRIAGPILLVLGFIYWFGGVHPGEWENNPLFVIFPSVGRFLIIPASAMWNSIDGVISLGLNGKFGAQLIAIAFILICVSRPSRKVQKNYYLRSVYSVSKLICASIFVWHCLMQMIESRGIFEGILFYLIIFIFCYGLGRGIGAIYHKVS